eukprot:TRINITY_DN5949_c0_g1_i1.p1 TRINITY_DN5949_c0_g1~~TRINITY_DN5949_c0_g1_i1.p1  ORF type:complete len:408 (-),score=74.50 TRINITY_DN5949_c0_g1_i1:577-1800(-)
MDMLLSLPITITIPPSLKHKHEHLLSLSIKTHFTTSKNTSTSRIRLSSSPNPSSSTTNFSSSSSLAATTTTTSVKTNSSVLVHCPSPCNHWIVVVDKPSNGFTSKAEAVDYYVKTLARVLGSEKEAQMCIYDVSWQTHVGFCCDIDEETSRQLAGVPGVLSVRPDSDLGSIKDYSFPNLLLSHESNSNTVTSQLSNGGNSNYWLVCMEKPAVEVVTKAQMVDYYAQTLTKVLGNEKDAQMCIYNVSWQTNFGFCCRIDEECAQELAGMPGVLSIQRDTNFESENKNYGGDDSNSQKSTEFPHKSDANQIPIVKTKRLFVTGLSFYTSEKTLRAAFEGFGELVEVKIIMDKISKRSKGYAFIEYTTEEAASAALKEMNGKIINGWMIVVDVAKTNPPKYSRGRPQPIV